MPFDYAGARPQIATISLNGAPIARFALDPGWRDYTFDIDRDALARRRELSDHRVLARRGAGGDRSEVEGCAAARGAIESDRGDADRRARRSTDSASRADARVSHQRAGRAARRKRVVARQGSEPRSRRRRCSRASESSRRGISTSTMPPKRSPTTPPASTTATSSTSPTPRSSTAPSTPPANATSHPRCRKKRRGWGWCGRWSIRRSFGRRFNHRDTEITAASVSSASLW